MEKGYVLLTSSGLSENCNLETLLELRESLLNDLAGYENHLFSNREMIIKDDIEAVNIAIQSKLF